MCIPSTRSCSWGATLCHIHGRDGDVLGPSGGFTSESGGLSYIMGVSRGLSHKTQQIAFLFGLRASLFVAISHRRCPCKHVALRSARGFRVGAGIYPGLTATPRRWSSMLRFSVQGAFPDESFSRHYKYLSHQFCTSSQAMLSKLFQFPTPTDCSCLSARSRT